MRKLEKEIEKRGGDQYVFDLLADGVSVGAVAKGIELEGHGPISRPFLYTWRNRDKTGQRREGWRLALEAAGEAHAERAGEVLDAVGADPSSAEVTLASKRANYLQWLAGKRDERFSDKGPDLNVQVQTVNVGLDHLQALMSHGAMPVGATAIPTAEVQVLGPGE
jgi:hypothetical protein